MRNLDFTALKNLHLFPWHCILKYHIRIWPSYFSRTTVSKSVGVFFHTKGHGLLSHEKNVRADQFIWELAANLCSWAMALQGRVPGVRRKCGSGSRPNSSKLNFSELLLGCHQTQHNVGNGEQVAFVHFTDVCNDDQIFTTIFYPTSPPLCHSEKLFFLFSCHSTQNFPLAASPSIIVIPSLKGRENEGASRTLAETKKTGLSIFV